MTFLGKFGYLYILRAIIACNHLPLFKIFSKFVHFCSNFQIVSNFQNVLNEAAQVLL